MARETMCACVRHFRIVPLGLVLALALLVAGPVGSSHAVTASPYAQASRVASVVVTRSAASGHSCAQPIRGAEKGEHRALHGYALRAFGVRGRVHLRAVVHGATKCRFSSARTVKGLPSSKRCVSGRASVNITLPNNRHRRPRATVFI
jgi:hypothetical protein